MAADLARITYDPLRQYRSVISQQGRVTLEADNNEAATIASEALRLETIDVVGPTGTPDDGYKVGPGIGPGGVSIGPGIFYLGGWRLQLDTAIDLSKQPDWLDAPPLTSGTGTTGAGGNLLVALLLTEQSVGATEDQALREVALGGPDSAGRARLMQQFLRLSLDGETCAAGAASVAKLLSAEGISIDPATLQLISAATLQAGFVPGPPNTDPCAPTAAGGYLGADNQLVRVTVIAYNATAKTGTLLWSWNNASLLYRASVTDPQTLKLLGTPVDEEHAPQLGQAVEILRCRSDLTDGNFIAAPEGFVTTLTQAYSFDTGELGLADALPAEYVADSQVAKLPLFVRLWQAKVPFNAGQLTPLDGVSGIAVSVTLPALPTTIALRPFWRFSVRPSTPVQIYPQRYQEKPQAPDGPRQWLTDLAVVQALTSGSTLLANCRVPFVPLTQQRGACCSLVLGPSDVDGRGGLQAVMDGLAGTQSSVALLAGTYTLAEPLVLGSQHSGLTLEGCGAGVELVAAAANLAPFRFGLVLLEAASRVTLRGLTFTIPNIPAAAPATGTVVTNPGTVIAHPGTLMVNAGVAANLGTISATPGAATLAINSPAANTLVANTFATNLLATTADTRMRVVSGATTGSVPTTGAATTAGPAVGAATAGPATGAASAGPAISAATAGAATAGPAMSAATAGPAVGAATTGPAVGAAAAGPAISAATAGPAIGAATAGAAISAANTGAAVASATGAGMAVTGAPAGTAGIGAAASAAAANAAGLIVNTGNVASVIAAPSPATSIGVLAAASPNLTVDSCNFRTRPDSPTVFGAGLYVLGEATGLTVTHCNFVAARYQPGATVFGVLVSVLNGNVTTTLDTAEISDNVFRNLPAGLAVFSQLGMVRCTGNRVVDCGAGLYFATSTLGATTEVTRQAISDTTQSATLSPAMVAGMQAPMLSAVLTQSAPFMEKAPPPAANVVSDVARNVLLQNVTTRGTATWRSLTMTSDVTPQAATQSAATQPAGTQQPAGAALDINMTNALNLVRDVSISAEIVGTTLVPVLHVSGNDVTLIGTGTTPGVGIAVVLSPRDNESGMVLMTANRVVTADTNTEAAAILFPTTAAVTGNVFLQTGSAKAAVPAFMLAAEAVAKIEVTANVIHTGAAIFPARANAAPTTSWNFLNTVG